MSVRIGQGKFRQWAAHNKCLIENCNIFIFAHCSGLMQNTPKEAFTDTSVAFSVKSDWELRKAYWLFAIVNKNLTAWLAIKFVKLGFLLRLPIKKIIKNTVFQHFCGGENIEDSITTAIKLGRYKVYTILDYSVEGEKTEAGFDSTLAEILRTFDGARQTTEIPFGVFKVTGVGSAELLTKVQNKDLLSLQEGDSLRRLKGRIENICQKAADAEVPVFIDAENSWYQEPIDDMALEMMRKFNSNNATVFNTFQLYRRGMLETVKRFYKDAVDNDYLLGAKLVRGAYMEKERDRAQKKGYADPIQPNKQVTDVAFDEALRFCIENCDKISLCCGSHNEGSNFYLTQLMGEFGLEPEDKRVWYAQLYGMSDNISFNLANRGYNVTKYVPYGPVEAVMPYLFRRATENTSIAGQSGREFRYIRTEIARRKQNPGKA